MTAKNARLYKLLDVDPHLTAPEIKSNFASLSLRDQFQKAYTILSDTDKKRMYDIGGERMVDYLQSKNWGPMVTVLGSRAAIRLYSVCLILGSILLLIWFAVLAAKLQGTTSTAWNFVFVPLFILLVGYLAVHVMSLVCSLKTTLPAEETDGRFLDRLPSWTNVTSAICYLIFAILVALHLGKEKYLQIASGGWTKVFILLIVGDALSILSCCLWRYPRKVRTALSPRFKTDAAPPSLVYGYSLIVVSYLVLAIVRWVLIGSKIDGKYTGTWYGAFAPIPVRLAIGVVETLLNGLYLRHLGLSSIDEIAFTTLGTLLFNGMVAVAVYIMAVVLEGGRLVGPGHALVPIFIFCAFLVIASVYTAVVLHRRYRELEEQDNKARMLHPSASVMHDPFAPTAASRRRAYESAIEVGEDVVSLSDRSEEEEEMEEVEVDVESEHFVDEDPDHSPFEGHIQPSYEVLPTHQYRQRAPEVEMHLNQHLQPLPFVDTGHRDESGEPGTGTSRPMPRSFGLRGSTASLREAHAASLAAEEARTAPRRNSRGGSDHARSPTASSRPPNDSINPEDTYNYAYTQEWATDVGSVPRQSTPSASMVRHSTPPISRTAHHAPTSSRDMATFDDEGEGSQYLQRRAEPSRTLNESSRRPPNSARAYQAAASQVVSQPQPQSARGVGTHRPASRSASGSGLLREPQPASSGIKAQHYRRVEEYYDNPPVARQPYGNSPAKKVLNFNDTPRLPSSQGVQGSRRTTPRASLPPTPLYLQ